VVVITNMYPPHHYGGYELLCRDAVTQWRERGHEALVLTTTWRVPGVADPQGEREQGVWRDLDFYWDDHELRSPPVWRRFAIERANQGHLRRAIDTLAPEVVSVWHMGAMSLGLLSTLNRDDLPMQYVIADDWLIYGPQLDAWSRIFSERPRAGRLVQRLTGVPAALPDLASSGQFCFASECTRRRADEHSRWRFDGAAVVPLGINPSDFPVPADPPPERAWSWNLLYVGRLDDRKGIDSLVRAMPLLPSQARLRLIGRGDERYEAHLQRLAHELGVVSQVSFGVADRSELASIYRDADVVVFPSTWDEPFGLVPLEAMACATPVVATGRGGSGEFLTSEVNSLWFSAGDPRSLADAVLRVACDRRLRRQLVEAGLHTARTLTTVRMADELEARLKLLAEGYFDRGPGQIPGGGAAATAGRSLRASMNR
jgi:glycosyltransferase involved in cell wall biosynthesis